MSKKVKSQASSSRAAASTFGSFGGFSSASSSQGREPSSLTYVTEPPDLSQIAEPQLAIAFKNFLKKDEVTRSKSLDDLKDYVSGVEARAGTLEDGFLEAWIKIYPRASIDLARKVRQLAHTIQGAVASLVGKRVARYLPKVIGAWIAGLYDNDRQVQRSAVESFVRVFSTEEKRSGVWKVYQSAILDFVDDVILQQTPQTLSDERTIKPDDVEAKYARVAGTAVLSLNRIIGNTSREDLQKSLPQIEILLSSKSLWSLCSNEDPFVRRSLYTLLLSAVAKVSEELDWKIISAAVIGKSLPASQIGSASELSESVLRITSTRPQLWTEDYTGKTSPSKRLLQYIHKGSQGGLSSFWTNLGQLLQTIPLETLKNVSPETVTEDKIGFSSATSLLEAFREGLNSRDEPSQNLAAGWKAYIDTGLWLTKTLSEDERKQLIQKMLSPIMVQHVKADPSQPKWSLPRQLSQPVCADCIAALASHGYENEVQAVWTELSNSLTESIKLSSPEQSKDFQSSQDVICGQAQRLLGLEAAALTRVSATEYESRILEAFETTSLPLLENSLQVLRTRNGKPYGAAAVVEESIRDIPQIARHSKGLLEFVQKDVPELLFSPSADRLITIILSCRSWAGYDSSFEKVIEQVIQLEPEQSNMLVLQRLLSTLDFKEIDDKSGLSLVIMRALSRACNGSRSHWSIIISVLQNPTSHGELTDSVFLSILDSLSVEDKVVETLHGLSQIASSAPAPVMKFQSETNGSKLAGKLLFLSESPAEEVGDVAESLANTLKETTVSETSIKSNIEILQYNFDHVNAESLSIDSLLSLAEELLHNLAPEQASQTTKSIFPSAQAWEKALAPFLQLPPRPSTAITSPIGGVLHLIDRELPETVWEQYNSISRDASHCSSAFRLAHFATKILSSFEVTDHLGGEELETLFYNLPLAIQLIDDDLSIEKCNGITGIQLPEQREEYLEIVYEGRKVVSGWVHPSAQDLSTKTSIFWASRLDKIDGTSPVDYRIGEAFVNIMESGASSKIGKSSEEIAQLCKGTRTANAIQSASWMRVLRPSVISNPAGTRLCNELVADSTGLNVQDGQKDELRKLGLLNLLFAEEQSVAASIPTQRLVFLVKHLISCLQSEIKSYSLKAEIIQTLNFVLPNLGEIYGSHWEDIIEILSNTWRETSGSDDGLLVMASSFRLFARLKAIVDDEESNDDVKDAWSDRKTVLFNDLTSTLRKFDSSTTFHQPRDVTVDLLCRLINVIPIKNLENVNKTFPLLTAHSRVVQRAAYIVLHRYIPEVQEQVSLDVALSNTSTRLPDELLSLLLEPPTMESISASFGEDRMWTGVRSYLLSWKVVFDHFTNASAAVQENYATSIKENDTLSPLLDFMFNFLQGVHGKIVDASKFDVRNFEPDQSDTAEKEIQWLLIHLYFLCLRHLANVTKNWWIDSAKRIKGPMEAWTEKYISPLIIEDSLRGVSDWVSTQDPNEERALAVKISPKTAEIIGSIEVDEESPPVALSISLPPAYPLQPALVTGRSRVLVDERRWKNWLVTIQGVIMFANGNLEDGLMAFRRNVQGALKGQSECAICYSVISTDMQTPNKRCATCKNTFHSVCLFRWFKSSNQSTCPLCRNNFVYV